MLWAKSHNSGKDDTMTTLGTSTPAGDWVAQYPQTARTLEELQIDYCCGGDRSLAEACDEQGLDADAVAARLADAASQSSAEMQPDWTTDSPTTLCDHIEATHHAFLRQELPRLTQLVEKVADVHGDNHAELHQLRAVFAELRAELEPHMMKEEQVLFPAIRQLEQAASAPQFPFGTVANPIRMMEHEHDIAGNALKRIRNLTADFTPLDDACNTCRVMLDGLQKLEADLHQHIHKENNILFPMAQRLNSELLHA